MADEESTKVAEFASVTGTDTDRARFYLEAAAWDLNTALSSFFDGPSEEAEGQPTSTSDSPPQDLSAEPPSQRTTTTRSGRVATVGRHQEGSDSDEDGQAFYAGGSEHSGQQILGPPRKKQTPHDLTKSIFDEARRHGAEEVGPGEDASGPAKPKAFQGAGYRLGNTEGGESQPLPSTVRSPYQSPQTMKVKLKFWSNGFSLDDGPLRNFDDPANAEFLKAVKKGEIPRELVRLAHGGEVHVDMEDHSNEDFVPPKRMTPAFVGKGRILGSPAPTVVSNPSAASSSAAAAPASQPVFEVDNSQPVTNLQIRLADGTRLVAKFNHTQRVSDIRQFVNLSRPASAGRPFILMTTFPNKVLSEETQTIAEANLLNAVVVQKYK